MSASGPQKFTFNSVLDVYNFFKLCKDNSTLFHEHLDDLKQQIKDNKLNLSEIVYSEETHGATLLELTCEYYHEIPEFILEQGANANVLLSSGHTLLELMANIMERRSNDWNYALENAAATCKVLQDTEHYPNGSLKLMVYMTHSQQMIARMQRSVDDSRIILKGLLNRTTDIEMLNSLELSAIKHIDMSDINEALSEAKVKARGGRPLLQFRQILQFSQPPVSVVPSRLEIIQAKLRLLEIEKQQLELQLELAELNANSSMRP